MEKLALKLGIGVDVLTEAVMAQIWFNFAVGTSLLLAMAVGCAYAAMWFYKNDDPPVIVWAFVFAVALCLLSIFYYTMTIIYNPVYYAIGMVG